MTKEELRTQYVGLGWVVQPVAEWDVVSNVNGTIKYDVGVVTPDLDFTVAQVIVTGDGQPDEEATPIGILDEPPPDFAEEARVWLRDQETSIATVFAIAVEEIYEADEVLTALVWNTDNTVARYVVKRRTGVFSFQLIA